MRGGVQHIVVAVDYFTKWAEMEPLSNTNQAAMISFVKKNIVSHSGYLRFWQLTMENNLKGENFKNFAKDYKSGISSPPHFICKLTDTLK